MSFPLEEICRSTSALPSSDKNSIISTITQIKKTNKTEVAAHVSGISSTTKLPKEKKVKNKFQQVKVYFLAQLETMQTDSNNRFLKVPFKKKKNKHI